MAGIQDFARKPKLIEIVLDDEGIITNYGEPITFFMRDFVDINTYFDFFRTQSEGKGDELNVLLRKIILNKEGEPAIGSEDGLPVDIAVAALTKIGETLGKSSPKSSATKNGTQSS